MDRRALSERQEERIKGNPVMERRTFLAMGATGLLAMPMTVDAQATRKPSRIAILFMGSPETSGPFAATFKQGLRTLGYIEGQNVAFESRWAMGEPERVPRLAHELVALTPDVIFVGAAVTARAAQQATRTIPIVGAGFDPVAQGLVKRLAKPDGNLTGLSSINIDVSAKPLELAREFLPTLRRVAVLLNPDNPGYPSLLKNLQTAARSMGLNLLVVDARTRAEIEDVFPRIAREGVTTVIVHGDSFFVAQRRHIVALALKHRIAPLHSFREMVEAGGLMSYGQNLLEQFRQAARYVDRILKGAKPGELPIQQSITLELVVNLRTAKALGLTIPPSLLLRADQVIE